MAQWLATILGNLLLFAALTSRSDTFKLEKESLQKQIDKLKAERLSRQGSKLNAKLAKFSQPYDAGMCALQERLRDRDSFIESL